MLDRLHDTVLVVRGNADALSGSFDGLMMQGVDAQAVPVQQGVEFRFCLDKHGFERQRGMGMAVFESKIVDMRLSLIHI